MVKEIMDNLHGLPCAFTIIQNDEDGTIIFANDVFYKEFQCTQADLEYKFGMRFSAMAEIADVLCIKQWLKAGAKEPLQMELYISVSGEHGKWVYAYMRYVTQSNLVYLMFFDIEEYKLAQIERVTIEAKLCHLIEQAEIDAIEFDPETYVVLHQQVQYFFKKEAFHKDLTFEEMMHDDIIHPDSLAIFENTLYKLLQPTEDIAYKHHSRCEIIMKNNEKEYVWTRLILAYYNDDQDTPYVMATFMNIDAEKKATSEYIQQSLYYQTMLSFHDGYGHIDISEDHLYKVGGLWNLYNELIKKYTYTEIFSEFIEKVVHPDDRQHYLEVMACKNITDSYESGIAHLSCEFRRFVDQNHMVWMRINIHTFKDPFTQHIMALEYIHNIDAEKKQQLAGSASLTSYDSLTKLADKKSTEELITHYLDVMPEQEISAFIYINVNNLKGINDLQGYDYGDEVLLYLSNLLITVFRKCDIIGRVGSDSFIILLKNVEFGRLQPRLDKLFELVQGTRQIAFALSAGVTYAKKRDTYASCMKQAAIALFKAKKEHGTYVFFEPGNLPPMIRPEEDQYLKNLLGQTNITNETAAKSFDTNFVELLGSQGDIAYLVNPETYELVEANDAFYSRVGLTVEECAGRTCYDIIHKRTHPCPFCQKGNWTMDKYYMYRNYNEVLEQEFLIKNKLVLWKGVQTLLAFAIDLSNNKSVVDTMDNGVTEDNIILNGVLGMQHADTSDGVLYQAMETITNFFQADCVRYWRRKDKEKTLELYPPMIYTRNNESSFKTMELTEIDTVTTWINGNRWNKFINIESQEAMMIESFDMYQLMVTTHIVNSRWISIQVEKGSGVFEIINISKNFQNLSFMTSFLTFVESELRKRRIVERIQYNAMHDTLTGLLNRASYDDYLKQYNEEKLTSVAIVVVDVNGLSSINAVKGLQTGDYCLQQLAMKISEIFYGYSAFRLSGDEFQIILHNINVDEIEIKIKALQLAVNEFGLFSISVGYAWDGIEKKLDTLVEYATQNMLHYKQIHRNQIQLDKDKAHFDIQSQLITNIENGSYVAFLQPKVDILKKRTIGAEALIRYRDDDGSIVPPIKYIPILEKNGLIRYIDLFVFEEVCKMLERWVKQGIPCPIISLNFSRITMMENNLINIMENIFHKYQIEKRFIEIEITESYADVGKALLYQSAKRISNAGYAVTLDDFGTDYTNLSILSDIHVDVLKIDKSLIHSLTIQEKNQIILKNIIQMCRDLNVEIIAEGVEDEEQRDILASLGCYLIQGYLYSRPITVSEFEMHFLDKTIT